jgi:hypothetical protein
VGPEFFLYPRSEYFSIPDPNIFHPGSYKKEGNFSSKQSWGSGLDSDSLSLAECGFGFNVALWIRIPRKENV